MSTIIVVPKNVAEFYNHLVIESGSGNLGCCGWGVKARDEDPGIVANTVICETYRPDSGAQIKYVRFRTVNVTGAPGDYVIFTIWRRRKAGGTLGDFENIYTYTIDDDVLDDNGYTSPFAASTNYTIVLPEAVYLTPYAGTLYYVSFYSSGAELAYDLTGTADGCWYVADDISDESTYPESSLTLDDYAVSAEAFAEPDSWVELEDGGCIEEENTDWQNALACTGDWTNPEHIYDGLGNATSVNNGEYIDIDLANQFVPADPWDPDGIMANYFPDYATYGVRSLIRITLDGTTDADSEITVQIHDEDSDTAPVVGWQTIGIIPVAQAGFSEDFSVPHIARWVKILESGAGGSILTDVNVYQFMWHVTDGKFYVDMSDAVHYNQVSNYPAADKVYRCTAGNMAGGVSSPQKPFTNRANRS